MTLNLSYLQDILQKTERLEPGYSLALFLAASFVIIWRLNAMEKKGIEGTILGTLIMPYCSGFANLAFAYILGRSGGRSSLILENCLVNNVTNLTLLIGLPALFNPLIIMPFQNRRKRKKSHNKTCELNYLSLMLTLIAMIFFTAVFWALGRDRLFDFSDGLVLVGLFLFWQILQVFEVLKDTVNTGRSLPGLLIMDLIVIALGAYGAYISIDRLVAWIPRSGSGLLIFDNLGWLSGLLMVLPNALLALYYAVTGRAEIVYSSQIGDGHICIPMCIGIFALFSSIQIPSSFDLSIFILLGAGLTHLLFIGFFKRLPRFMGASLTAAYIFFIFIGLVH